MSNVNTSPPNPDQIDDITSIGKIASDAAGRRLALDYCLSNPWLTADVGRLERVDKPTWHGWRMWRWQMDDGK